MYYGAKRNRHIPALSHRVTFCSMDDVISEDGRMELSRRVALPEMWANIQPTKPNFFSTKPSFFSTEGRGILDPNDKPTHSIFIRPRFDVSFGSTAWVYEKRMISAPRWYKVIGILEQEAGYEFTTRLVERSDTAVAPVADKPDAPAMGATPLPVGVRL